MKALQYIEIDVPYCALIYSHAPCAAVLGVTGDIKCFNSLGTCQDRANFSNAPVTLRFAVQTAYLPRDIEAIPSIKSIGFDPATLSLGGNLGQRATLTVMFDDHPHSDTGEGFDKYLGDSPPARDYDPYSQGTFWGKFRVRHPFLRGRSLRWITGLLGDELADMDTRHFVIDSFTGPTPQGGEFTIIAKDVLKLADGDRALAPAPSNGFLVSDITAIATTATLSPSGIGNLEYPASGYVNIAGREIASFTRSGDVLTLTRGQLDTTAAAQRAGDRVQVCLRYVAQDPAVVAYDLLVTYAGVDPSFITLSDWQTETATYWNRLVTTTIANPTSVNALLSELIEQSALVIWWRDDAQKIGLQVLHGIVTSAERFTEDNVRADTLALEDQPTKRVSQVLTYFGQISALTSLTDKANFRSLARLVDEQAEEDEGSAAIKEIYSRWIPGGGRTIADRLNAILLGRYITAPRRVRFEVMRHVNPIDPQLAGGYLVRSWAIQDETGAADELPIQVTRLNPKPDVFSVEAEEMLFNAPADDLTNRSIVIDSNLNNVNFRTLHDTLFPTPTGGITVTCTINASAIVGSSSTATPAFDVGTWPGGVALVLVILGRIEGAGGVGGRGADGTININGLPGAVGGPALYTRTAIDLDVSAGEIFAGGGGGGGAGGRGELDGSGGGGGGGQLPGVGGAPGVGGFDGQSGSIGTTEAGGPGGSSTGSGGTGGAPGFAGAAGAAGLSLGGAGGAAGAAVDGISFVTVTAGPGDIRGAEIN